MCRGKKDGTMSRYYTKSNTDREFIVVKHKLTKIETTVMGVRYREGYAVVEKDSKVYKSLKTMKMAIDKEFPITYLDTLGCVVNDRQIQYIWGKEIYNYFLSQKLNSESTQPEALREAQAKLPFCEHIKDDGVQCKSKALKVSDYCRSHLQSDERLVEDFAAMPKYMEKADRKKYIDKLIKKLEK